MQHAWHRRDMHIGENRPLKIYRRKWTMILKLISKTKDCFNLALDKSKWLALVNM